MLLFQYFPVFLLSGQLAVWWPVSCRPGQLTFVDGVNTLAFGADNIAPAGSEVVRAGGQGAHAGSEVIRAGDNLIRAGGKVVRAANTVICARGKVSRATNTFTLAVGKDEQQEQTAPLAGVSSRQRAAVPWPATHG